MPVKKMILIDEKHQGWIEKRFINLSKYIRAKIDEDMKKESGEHE